MAERPGRSSEDWRSDDEDEEDSKELSYSKSMRLGRSRRRTSALQRREAAQSSKERPPAQQPIPDFLINARRKAEADSLAKQTKDQPLEQPASGLDRQNETLAAEREPNYMRRVAQRLGVVTRRLLGSSDEMRGESTEILDALHLQGNVTPEETDEAVKLEATRGQLDRSVAQLEEATVDLGNVLPTDARSDEWVDAHRMATERVAASRPAQAEADQPVASEATAFDVAPAHPVSDWAQVPLPRYYDEHSNIGPVSTAEVEDLQDDIDSAHDRADTAFKAAVGIGAANFLYTHHEKVRAKRNEANLAKTNEHTTEQLKHQEQLLEEQKQTLDRIERRPAERVQQGPVTVERLTGARNQLGELAHAASTQGSITRETQAIIQEQHASQVENRTLLYEQNRSPVLLSERPPQPEETSNHPLWSERRFAEHIEKGPGMVAVESPVKTTTGAADDQPLATGQTPLSADPLGASPHVDTPADHEQKTASSRYPRVPSSPPTHLIAFVAALGIIALCLLLALAKLAHLL